MKKEETRTSLRLLILSDIHESMAYLDRVSKWYLEKTKSMSMQFDYVLVPGDSGTVQYGCLDSKIEEN